MDRLEKRSLAPAATGNEAIGRTYAANHTTTTDAETAFLDAIREAGLPPVDPAEIVADGEIHRFRVEGDRSGRKNGWAVLHLDRVPAGAFGSWKHGTSGTWRANRAGTLTAAEHRQIANARAKREAERRRQRQHAAERAARIWAEAKPADPKHPYIHAKRVKPHKARQSGDRLVLPLFDFERRLWSLQFIAAGGDKKLLRDGRKAGCFIPVAGRAPAARALICEGWATGATLAESEPESLVLAAVDAGNLEPVAIGARRAWPDAELVVCADADDIGLAKARQAARAADALVAVPEFPPGVAGTDFNDLANGSTA